MLAVERLPTAFSEVLRALVVRIPNARSAIFLDFEGESIDEFSEGPPTEVRLTGAHFGVVLALARDRQHMLGVPEEIIVETEHTILIARALDHQYLVVLEAGAQASLGLMRRELDIAAEALRAHM